MRDQVSFTGVVKNEISAKKFDDLHLKSLLAAFIRLNGRLIINSDGDSIILKTENAKIAKFIFVSLQNFYKISPRFAYVKRMRLNKGVTYNVIVEQQVNFILEDLEMLDFKTNMLSFIKNDDGISGFLAGAFLATGSVNNPSSSNYHLEISTSDEDQANYIIKLIGKIRSVAFEPKIILRRNQYVVYLKKSNQIADFLAFIGAEETCLEFENIRIYRDYTNNDNRLQICTNANMGRTVESAKRQQEDISIIDRRMGIKNIPNPKMRLLCIYRKNNEEASMVELAEMLEDELDMKVSKSSVNHTFRAIHELAVRLSKGESHGKNKH